MFAFLHREIHFKFGSVGCSRIRRMGPLNTPLHTFTQICEPGNPVCNMRASGSTNSSSHPLPKFRSLLSSPPTVLPSVQCLTAVLIISLPHRAGGSSLTTHLWWGLHSRQNLNIQEVLPSKAYSLCLQPPFPASFPATRAWPAPHPYPPASGLFRQLAKI